MTEAIVLGLGNNIDYEIVWDSSVMEDLVRRYDIGTAELSTSTDIRSERDLVISILGFLQSGTGGERFVAASNIIEDFSRQFELKVTLGGTSVRSAIAMRKLGHRSALHLVTINDHVRSLIPPDSPYVCSNTVESSYPHLIVQFGQDTCVRAGDIDIRTSRANRIIYHNDLDNIAMALSDALPALCANAKVLLISGFNAMQDEDLLRKRLATLLPVLKDLPQDARVFCEDAGYYDPTFSRLIYTTLADHIDIISLNEDELQGYLGRPVNLLDATQMLQALAELHAIIPAPVIVVHTMYWALAYGENVADLDEALRGGVTMATTRFCYGDEFGVQEYQEIAALPSNTEGAQYAAAVTELLPNEICCVPVAAVTHPNPTTIGLGDAFVGGFLPALVE